jgi:hypothetical protein
MQHYEIKKKKYACSSIENSNEVTFCSIEHRNKKTFSSTKKKKQERVSQEGESIMHSYETHSLHSLIKEEFCGRRIQ